MRVHVLSVGDRTTASTHFRFVQYTERLAERGVELVLHDRKDVTPELLRGLDGEVVVLQKILLGPRPLRLLRRSARRLLFDFDDAIWTRPGKPFSWPTQVRVTTRLHRCLRTADAVTAASEYLTSYARPHARTCERIPMTIDTAAWPPRARDEDARERIAVGWAGSPINLAFLQAMAPALQRLLEERDDVEVRIYCGRRPELPFAFTHQAYEPGTEAAFVRELDVGLCPLEDHPFARGKSPIKILQYLSCGVPVVASEVGASRELLDPAWSRGVPPDATPEHWHRALVELLDDAEARRTLAQRGRRFVEEQHDLDVGAERLRALLRG